MDEVPREIKPTETESRRMVVRGWRSGGGAEGESVFHGEGVPVWDNGKVLEVDGSDGYTTM